MAAPGANLNIGTGSGQNKFKVQLPIGSSVLEKTVAEIGAGYTSTPEFYTVTSGGVEWIHFQAQMDGPQTSGSSYARSELREMNTNGTTNMSWDAHSGTHYMEGESRITHLPPVKPEVVVAQLFDEVDRTADWIAIRTQAVSSSDPSVVRLSVRVNGSLGDKTGTGGNGRQDTITYAINRTFSWRIESINGTTKVYIDGAVRVTVPSSAIPDSTSFYFKHGCYNQSNETIDSASEYCAVETKANTFEHWHTNWPTPTGGGSGDPEEEEPVAGTGFIGYLQSTFGSALTHYYPLNNTYQAQDVIGGLDGTVTGTVSFTTNGAVFSGAANNYITIPDNPDFSLASQTSNGMAIIVSQSVSDWASTSNLRDDGFCHWMGKGQANAHEWVFRYYPSPTHPNGEAGREKRTSFYHFNSSGQQGAGSYTQDDDATNLMRNFAVNMDDVTTTGVTDAGTAFPGAIWLYKNGTQRDADGFVGAYNITPQNTVAPVTIGCRNDKDSWQKGTIRRVAFFNRKLTTAEITGIQANQGLTEGTPDTGTAPTAPVANAGADRTVDPQTTDTFTLTGTGTDSDGTIASYTWHDMTSGTPVLIAGTGASRTITVPKSPTALTRSYRLTVTDNTGLTGTDTVTVNITRWRRWLMVNGTLTPIRRRAATGPVVPSLVVGLTASPATVTVGGTVTLTATASGGTSPYTPTWTAPAGVTLTGTATSMVRTFVAGTASTPTIQVSVNDSTTPVKTQTATATVTINAAPAATGQKFAGHVPNRVLVGMATPGGVPRPGWDEARTIIGQPIYEARRFDSNWIAANSFNSMVEEADAANAVPFLSWKVPGGSDGPGWAATANGNDNAGLLNLFNLAVAYDKPIVCSLEHEPTGTGITDADLCEWARMHIKCAYYFAGYRNATVGAFTTGGNPIVTKGTYNAAHDISINNGGNFSWAPIPNGFVWRAETTTLVNQRRAMCPQALVNALNECKGLLCPDFYDVDYVDMEAAFTDEAYRTPESGGVRTSQKIQKFITWQRSVGLNASGCGEYGCIDGTDMLATWAVMRANRDVWCFANFFNSGANSDHDWRAVPEDFPDYGYVSSKTNSAGQGFRIYGGNAQSQGRLDALKTTLTQSISATYTSPL